MAQAFAEAGADLVLVGRDEGSLASRQGGAAALGRKVDALAADISNAEAADARCARRCWKSIGPIDILVNNVGGRRENIATEDDAAGRRGRRLIDLNLTSAFVCTQAARRRRCWRAAGAGSSTSPRSAARSPTRSIHGRHYETAKAALVGFTRAVAADWAPHGVTVNAIAPGGFLTDAEPPLVQRAPECSSTRSRRLIPMGRLGEPDEIGPLALYLASEASRYMTGATLVIDGGYTLW